MGEGRKKLRILLVADDFRPPHDEGFKKITFHLSLEMSRRSEFLALATRAAAPDLPFPLRPVRCNRLFLSPSLALHARTFRPDLVLYVPFSSFTRNSFFRCRVLRAFCPRAGIVMIGVQERTWRAVEAPLLRRWAPHRVLTPAPRALDRLGRLGITASFLPFGLDLERFRPLPEEERLRTRTDLSVPATALLYLHVGQITHKRNVELLARLCGPGREVVVVGSSSSAAQGFPHDPDVSAALEKAGARVIVRHLPDIHRLYAAADCYVFPAFRETAGIAFPLSVVEALGSGTRVVSTRFGGLPRELPEGPAIRYASSGDELLSLCLAAPRGPDPSARDMVAHLGWNRLAERILHEAG